jgi:YHS domain-containing protein
MCFLKKVIAVSAIGWLGFSAASAEEKLQPFEAISVTTVHMADVVDAAKGVTKDGEIGYAIQTGDQVHYLRSETCGLYALHPEKYPDIDKGYRLAEMGVDTVAWHPYGVHNEYAGSLTAGNPSITATYKGATFAFMSVEHRDTFMRQPELYVVAVGGYCLRAMGGDQVVLGDPRTALYLNVDHIWATFGSLKGRQMVASMTLQQQHALYVQAVANYEHKLAGAAVAQK